MTLERAVRANAADHQARYWLAFTCLALSDYEAAIRQFERIEERYKADSEFLFAASEAYTRRARQLSDQLSDAGEASSRRHQHLAHRHLARQDEANALVELDLAIQSNPRLAGLHEEKAEILWRRQDLEAAVRALQAELAIAPGAFQANLRYGQYLLQQRQPAQALSHLRIAAAYWRYPEAHQLLAYALEQLGRAAESQGVVTAALRRFPDHDGLPAMLRPSIPPAPYRLGTPAPAATPSLAELRRRPPSDESAFWLQRIYSERAAALAERLAEAAPDSARLAQLEGLNCEYIEDYACAERHYRDALRKSPQTAGLRFALGHALRLLGRDEDAEAELAREVQSHLTLFERALIRVKQGQTAEAIPMFEETAALAPLFFPVRTELAKAYLQAGQAAKAVPLLKEVVSREPGHRSAHYLLGRAYRALNQPVLAQRELEVHRKLMEQSPGKPGAGGSSLTSTP